MSNEKRSRDFGVWENITSSEIPRTEKDMERERIPQAFCGWIFPCSYTSPYIYIYASCIRKTGKSVLPPARRGSRNTSATEVDPREVQNRNEIAGDVNRLVMETWDRQGPWGLRSCFQIYSMAWVHGFQIYIYCIMVIILSNFKLGLFYKMIWESTWPSLPPPHLFPFGHTGISVAAMSWVWTDTVRNSPNQQ